ncbi:MAG: hypothetical protein EP307_05425 [Rhodobacteraceae bacterium]|nr:MAG: hypothetical protein EP307_05425 [Paracoccaceae bacterium]
MKRLLWVLLLLVARPAFAQDEPRLVLDFEQTATIPGQPLELRLTVLVPTYLPKSPVWPSLETENVLVRVDATRPTSQRVGSATWSGVTRRYLVTPMVPGDFALAAQQVSITWADPESNAPRETTLLTEKTAFSGVVPPGAEGLSPFLAARSVELDQRVEGPTEGLAPGDSVIRVVTAKISGTSPMFLPPLLGEHDITGIRAYGNDHVIETQGTGADISGTRTEKITLIAESGGSGTAPAVELSWFNLDTGKLETTRLEAIPFSVDAPPASVAGPRRESLNLRELAFAGVALIVGLAALLLTARYGLPPAQRAVEDIRQRWQHSEYQGWRAVRHFVRRRDYPGLRPAIDTWLQRLNAVGLQEETDLRQSLGRLGEARYSPRAGQVQEDWRELERSLARLRRTSHASVRKSMLPPLNRSS